MRVVMGGSGDVTVGLLVRACEGEGERGGGGR